MPLTLKSLGTRTNRTTVRFRGVDAEVRGLSSAERDRIAELYLEPLPPLGRDPRLGSSAPADTPDPTDTAYRRDLMRWRTMRTLLRFAVALDWETEDGRRWDPAEPENGKLKKWAEMALGEIGRMDPPLSDAEADIVLEASGRCEAGAVEGDPRKNSSSTSAEAGVAASPPSSPPPGPSTSP